MLRAATSSLERVKRIVGVGHAGIQLVVDNVEAAGQEAGRELVSQFAETEALAVRVTGREQRLVRVSDPQDHVGMETVPGPVGEATRRSDRCYCGGATITRRESCRWELLLDRLRVLGARSLSGSNR